MFFKLFQYASQIWISLLLSFALQTVIFRQQLCIIWVLGNKPHFRLIGSEFTFQQDLQMAHRHIWFRKRWHREHSHKNLRPWIWDSLTLEGERAFPDSLAATWACDLHSTSEMHPLLNRALLWSSDCWEHVLEKGRGCNSSLGIRAATSTAVSCAHWDLFSAQWWLSSFFAGLVLQCGSSFIPGDRLPTRFFSPLWDSFPTSMSQSFGNYCWQERTWLK